jgi:tripartite-type tricarboxylate transporter receptor subunit TctC
LATRLIAKETEKYLKQPIVPVNKPGGSLAVGTTAIATAKPDGYTIGSSMHAPMLVIPNLQKVPYDPIKDFKQIMQFGSYNFGIIVKYDSPFRDFKDIIAYARQNPNKLTYGTPSYGLLHFVMEQILKKEGVQVTRIPTKGTAETEIDLLGGHIQVGVVELNYSLIEAKQTRVVLVLRDEPSAEYPQIPILKDLGYDIPCPIFMGVQGPKGIPEGIVKKIEDAFTNAMKGETFIKGMKEIRYPIVYRNSNELSNFISHNFKIYEKIVKESLK